MAEEWLLLHGQRFEMFRFPVMYRSLVFPVLLWPIYQPSGSKGLIKRTENVHISGSVGVVQACQFISHVHGPIEGCSMQTFESDPMTASLIQ